MIIFDVIFCLFDIYYNNLWRQSFGVNPLAGLIKLKLFTLHDGAKTKDSQTGCR